MTVKFRYSEVESERFGFKVHRFDSDHVDDELMDAVCDEKPDLAIIRVPTSEITRVHRLAKLGAAPIVADTLVYYRRPVDPADLEPILNTDLEFRLSGEEDRRTLEALTGLVFTGYRNHYMANPRIDTSWLHDGYIEWASSYLQRDGKHFCWIVYDGPRAAAFITGRRDGSEFEDVLGGVHPDWRNRTLYGDLLNCTLAHASGTGCTSMLVSTQIDNIAVQKTWIRKNFFLERSVNTIHLNLFPNESHRAGISAGHTCACSEFAGK